MCQVLSLYNPFLIIIFKFLLIFCFMQHKDVNVLWYGHYCNSLECCKAMSGENIVTPFNKLGICLYMWKMIIYTTQKIRGTHHLSKICCTRIVCPTSMWTDGAVLCPTTSSPYAFANLSCEIYHIWLIFVWNTKFQCQWMNYAVAMAVTCLFRLTNFFSQCLSGFSTL